MHIWLCQMWKSFLWDNEINCIIVPNYSLVVRPCGRSTSIGPAHSLQVWPWELLWPTDCERETRELQPRRRWGSITWSLPP